MHNFEYFAVDSYTEALDLLSQHQEATVVSGGMTLIPALKQRMAQPTHLVDISRIPHDGIVATRNTLIIPATMTHAEVAASPLILDNLPGLAQTAAAIGDPMVRHRGTLGGAVAVADPAADYPAALLGLNATLQTTLRCIPVDEFFTGFFATALQVGELITAVEFTLPQASCYAKFPQPASMYALVGVFVARFEHCVRVGVTGAGPFTYRALSIEKALQQQFDTSVLADSKVEHESLNSDIHASGEYRAHLVTAMTARAVREIAATTP